MIDMELLDNIMELFGENRFDPTVSIRRRDVPKNYKALSITEDKRALLCFQYDDNGTIVFIPEPDPILIYFDTAYNNFKEIKERRKTLLDHFKGKKMDENYLIALYAFYGAVNGFTILLFTAIEAFINHNIPENYEHVVNNERRKEIYSKNQIMLLPFKDKVGPILKDIFKKDFSHSYKMKYQHINNLKEMRDNIVHLKPEKGNTPYAYIFKKALTFKFEETIDSVMDFMNFYKPGYVDYCSCPKDF